MVAIVVALVLVAAVGGVVARRLVRRYQDLLSEARREARHDGLTGVLTRTAFGRELERRIARAHPEAPIALLSIDVDGFGQLNKQRGHAVGDELLIHLAHTLTRATRSGDAIGRLGGDEFAVLVDASDAVAIGERILAALRGHGINHEGIAVSIGVAEAPRHGSTVAALLRAADVAMRRAKRTGKGRVVVYTGESLADREEKRARVALAETIASNRISMVAQPIVDLQNGTVVAYEALARFEVSGNLSTGELFALAERVGMRDELDLACLSHGLALFPQRPAGTRLTVNVAGPLLADPRATALLAEQGDLQGLVLEITEEALVRDYDALRRAVGPLLDRGARIAVDDMGAGYSGLRHVIDLQPTFLKLDRTLISGVDRDAKRAALVDALLHYARNVGSHIVAEGVETMQELETLRQLGVPLAQGYLLARPALPWPSLALELTPRRAPAGADAVAPGSRGEVATVAPETTAEDAHARFAADPSLEALVVLDGQRHVLGLLTRHRLLSRLGHRFGFALYGQRSVLSVADRQALVLPETMPWREIASRAMARTSETRHDPIVLMDAGGRYASHLTIRTLLHAAGSSESGAEAPVWSALAG